MNRPAPIPNPRPAPAPLPTWRPPAPHSPRHTLPSSPSPSTAAFAFLTLLATLATLATACLPAAHATPASTPPSPTPPAWPPLAELSDKLRAELPFIPSPDASHTNAETYTRTLSPWVLLPPAPEPAEQPVPPLLRTNLYPGAAAYLRVGTVSTPLHDAISNALQSLTSQQPLSGLVLDLRFASGSDLAAGILAASPLATRPSQTFQLATNAWTPLPSPNAPAFPVLVLVNPQTRQAAEALAAAVRALAAKPLILGTPTAGQARAYRPFPVSDSLTLRIAADPLRLPNGDNFPTNGLQPDLTIEVPEADERAYAADEYQRVVRGRTFIASGPGRLNEAELVRRRRSPRAIRDARDNRDAHPDFHRTADPSGNAGDAAPRSVQDPALALALDLISGWASETANPQPDPNSQPANSR